MKKLVGYITSSLPNNNFTIDLAYSMKDAGVDTLELGIPFSDPVADGPVIEKANLIALNNGFKLKDLFEVSSKIAKDIDTLWMGYLNPFYHFGMEKFLQKAQEFGIKGTIIPDLPYEMAQNFEELFKKYNKTNISFAIAEIFLIFSSFDKLSSIICFTNALPTITPSTPMIFSLQVFSSTPKPI